MLINKTDAGNTGFTTMELAFFKAILVKKTTKTI